jgi:hypothetical protein
MGAGGGGAGSVGGAVVVLLWGRGGTGRGGSRCLLQVAVLVQAVTHRDVLLRLALELVFDGACGGGELQGERHAAGRLIDRHVFDEAACHDVLPEIGVYDARQLRQHLLLQAGLGCGGRLWVWGQGGARKAAVMRSVPHCTAAVGCRFERHRRCRRTCVPVGGSMAAPGCAITRGSRLRRTSAPLAAAGAGCAARELAWRSMRAHGALGCLLRPLLPAWRPRLSARVGPPTARLALRAACGGGERARIGTQTSASPDPGANPCPRPHLQAVRLQCALQLHCGGARGGLPGPALGTRAEQLLSVSSDATEFRQPSCARRSCPAGEPAGAREAPSSPWPWPGPRWPHHHSLEMAGRLRHTCIRRAPAG